MMKTGDMLSVDNHQVLAIDLLGIVADDDEVIKHQIMVSLLHSNRIQQRLFHIVILRRILVNRYHCNHLKKKKACSRK